MAVSLSRRTGDGQSSYTFMVVLKETGQYILNRRYMRMKHLSSSLFVLSIVMLIIGVSTSAHGEDANRSNSYVALKQLIRDDPRS